MGAQGCSKRVPTRRSREPELLPLGGNHSDGCPNLWGALCYGLDSLVREHVVDIKHRRSWMGPRHVA